MRKDVCSKCCNTGTVFHRMVMIPCDCPNGKMTAAKDWAGTKVHSEDAIKKETGDRLQRRAV